MGGRGTRWLAPTVPRRGRSPFWFAVAIAIAIAWVVARDILLQARLQRSRSAALDPLGQISARILGREGAALVGLVLAGKIRRVGQQVLDLAIAKDPARGNGAPPGNRAGEGARV